MSHASTHRNILIVGATSAIAEACARRWAGAGTHFFLLARSAPRLILVAQDLAARGAKVDTAALEISAAADWRAPLEATIQSLKRIDLCLVAHGDLPSQSACETDVAALRRALLVNAIATVEILSLVAEHMSAQHAGVIAVIGSVAGDVGRKSNYVYGSAKAMVATFAQGLAGRMLGFGVAVITIKPGFVDTPMTAHLKKGILWASPGFIAEVIDSRVSKRRSGTYYAPRFWWLIMTLLKHLPDRLLYRLNF